MQKLEELIAKYNEGTCSPEEKTFVEQWYQFFDWKNPPEGLSENELLLLKEQVWLSVKNKRKITLPATLAENAIPRVHRIPLWRYAVAVMIIAAIAGIGLFRYYSNLKQTVVPVSAKILPVKDLPPGASKAKLLLANGKAVTLDSIQDISLTEADGTIIDQQSGRLVYKGKSNAASETSFNTLVVPRGGEYQLILADGTKVWMNAASSLRYPTMFVAKERIVYLSGEAYFEVAKNAKMPFKVITDNGMTVEALGTKFDIMAYDDERSVKAALAEGSVRVTNQDNAVLLSPSQLAEWQKGKRNLRVDEADMDKILAWKNGMIEFGEDDLPSIMRQLSRWYDVEVSFAGHELNKRYIGSIRRQSKLSQVLEILKEAGVECSLEGRKLVVE